MLYGILFSIIFVGFFVLRLIAATVFFYFILPEGDRCPCCDTPTIRVQSKGFNTIMPWFRTSWCYHCHWEGVLRHGDITPVADNPPVVKSSAAPGSRSGPSRTS